MALRNTRENEKFWLPHRELSNLLELHEELENMQNELFNKHVNQEKNDFARWIAWSIKDEELANLLKQTNCKEKTRILIKGRINSLEYSKI